MIGVGVVGCGMISRRRYLPEIASSPLAAVRAVTDRNGERAVEMGAQYGAAVEGDYQALLARPDVDAVVVAVPNRYHFEYAMAALRAGKHLLLEKPMAGSLAEADLLLGEAEARERVLMMAFNQRFMPVHQAAKKALDAGLIGKVHTFSVAFGHSGPEVWSPTAAWFYDRERSFAGALLDLGIHKIDLLLWLLGSRVTEVAAMAGTLEKPSTEVEDNAVCLLRFESGVFGTLAASWTHKVREQNDLILYGEKGTLRIDGTATPPAVLLLEEPVRGSMVLDLPAVETNATAGRSRSGVIDHFLESVHTGRRPLVSGEEGRDSLEVVVAALQSARAHRMVQLPLPPEAGLMDT